jgi:hypothetical protein
LDTGQLTEPEIDLHSLNHWNFWGRVRDES